MYKLTIAYDGEQFAAYQYSDALSAVFNFEKCIDFGDAKEYATYNMSDPMGKMYTKIFFRDERGVQVK